MRQKRLLNLGCGVRYHPEWVNMDFYSHSKNVIAHNLLKGIPFPDNEFDVVYHSHLLEHFPKNRAETFIRECLRVLKPGGIIRIAVPDLEDIARLYLEQLDKATRGDSMAEHKYDWILLELYDQTVRNYSGGEMAEYLKQQYVPNEEFILERCGSVARQIRTSFLEGKNQTSLPMGGRNAITRVIASILLTSKWRDVLARICLRKDYNLLQVGRFRLSGEVHQWMYDRHSLARLLTRCGFKNPQVKTAFESDISDWGKYELDVKDDVVHAPKSLFMEAVKPGLKLPPRPSDDSISA
jgi:predicted SAM-dependent methyltransferase